MPPSESSHHNTKTVTNLRSNSFSESPEILQSVEQKAVFTRENPNFLKIGHIKGMKTF